VPVPVRVGLTGWLPVPVALAWRLPVYRERVPWPWHGVALLFFLQSSKPAVPVLPVVLWMRWYPVVVAGTAGRSATPG